MININKPKVHPFADELNNNNELNEETNVDRSDVTHITNELNSCWYRNKS